MQVILSTFNTIIKNRQIKRLPHFHENFPVKTQQWIYNSKENTYHSIIIIVVIHFAQTYETWNMKKMAKVQSVEPNIADLANGWLKTYNLNYKLEQESLNSEIDKALYDYFTKSGGNGGNRPDVKILMQDKNLEYYPILIEYKGYKNKLIKLNADGLVDNSTSKNEPNFKNIREFAVNGAIHYANALLHHTSYTDIIAIGVTGYKDESGTLQHEIGVY